MKTMHNKKKILFTFIAFVIISFIISVALYKTDYGYDRIRDNLRNIPIIGKYLDNTYVEIVDELDVYKQLKSTPLNSDKYVDLILSGSDLKALQVSIKKFQKNGFIIDEKNNWRKAKELVDGKKIKIKYKIHGTSIGSTQNSHPNLFDALKEFVGADNFDPISSGGVSFKIKRSKDSPYRKYIKNYVLKSPNDAFNISKIAINKIASNYGLITPHGEIVILKINGSKIAPYYLVENYNSKEWFERNHNLTNYTVIKSNDDWDHAGPGNHASRTDLFIHDKEVSGVSPNHPVALGKLNKLFEAIKVKDVEIIQDLIDVRYAAKFLSILSIFHNLHTITGDQLRYIYDHRTGRFKFIFKLENWAYSNQGSVADFNAKLFMKPAAQTINAKTYDLFKLLLSDPDFRELRDRELFKHTLSKNKFFKLSDKVFDENIKTLNSGNIPLEPINNNYRTFKKKLKNNLNLAEKYLKYAKVYVTLFKEKNQNKLSIINDSNNPVILKAIKYSNNLEVDYQKIIKSNELDLNLEMKHKQQNIVIKKGIIEKLEFLNSITGEVIDQKHIYLNHAKEYSNKGIKETLDVMNRSNLSYVFDKVNRSFSIKKGGYIIQENIIFPKDYSVIVEAGVELLLKKDISILVKGNFYANGLENLPIVIRELNQDESFGSFAILGNTKNFNDVHLNYIEIKGGSSAKIDGVTFLGQLSIHNSKVSINNIKVSNSISDDGINIVNSKVEIFDSHFFDNFSDQIDLDYSSGKISRNFFSVDQKRYVNDSFITDGLDISGGKVEVSNNQFQNFTDKAISIGEGSIVYIDQNHIENSEIGVAVKDGSIAFLGKNNFEKNKNQVLAYVKKKMYRSPQIYSSEQIENSSLMKYNLLKKSFLNQKALPYE